MKKKKTIAFIFAILLVAVSLTAAVYISLSPSSIQLPTFTTPTTNAQTETTQTTGTSQKTATTQAGKSTTTISLPPDTSFVTLEIKNWGFNPNVITISKGSTAKWANLDSKVHTVTSSGNFDSGDIPAGGTWTYTFSKAGTFNYNDKYDPSMQAMVVITE